MIMRDIQQEVQSAMEALGQKNFRLEIVTLSYHKLIVFANDVRFGIYDMDKHTFCK